MRKLIAVLLKVFTVVLHYIDTLLLYFVYLLQKYREIGNDDFVYLVVGFTFSLSLMIFSYNSKVIKYLLDLIVFILLLRAFVLLSRSIKRDKLNTQIKNKNIKLLYIDSYRKNIKDGVKNNLNKNIECISVLHMRDSEAYHLKCKKTKQEKMRELWRSCSKLK